jgi:hypothetical protein
LALLPLNALAGVCDDLLQAWRDMGGSTSYTNGCTIPGVTMSGSQVVRIDWSSKALNTAISPIIATFTSMTYLSFWGNQLTGSIPREFGNLVNLQELWLSRNRLTGSIPSELGQLYQLTRLQLEGNQLSGSIPKELGNLMNLDYLWLYANQLTGTIPPELANLSRLTRLFLNDNRLNGSIPAQLASLPKVQEVQLHNNQLTGTIPIAFGNFPQINHPYFKLFLSNNKLTGSISESLKQIKYFNIQYNSGIQVSNLGVFKASSFDSGQIRSYFQSVSFKRAIVTESQVRQTLCNLNEAFTNQEILNQCLAGIQNYCSSKDNFATCKSLYNETFKQSMYAGIEVCAPWNSGWKSQNCNVMVTQVKNRFTTDFDSYKRVFVDFLQNDILSNSQYAPCYVSDTQSCNY